jgi:beta-lactamase class A
MNALALLLFAATLTVPPDAGMVVGVSAVHLESGRSVRLRGGESFPMGSVYKFPIAVAVLRRVDRGQLKLDQKVTITPAEFSISVSRLRDEANGKPVTTTLRDLVRRMLGESDNTACDVLMTMLGGGPAITKELGIKGLRLDRTEKQIGADIDKLGREHFGVDPRDTSTPDAMLELLRRFHQGKLGLSKGSTEFANRVMIETKTGPNRIVSVMPKGAVVAHKTGTMPGVTNDVGIITSPDGKQHILVAIFTKQSQNRVVEEREKIVAEMARQVYAQLMR